MSRGANKQATQLFNQSQGVANTAQQNGQQLYSQLFPTLSAEATDPKGYAPEDLAAINTATQQSVGGSTAGAVGQGDLVAARTRNSGGFQPSIDEALRTGGRDLSQKALTVQGANADLKEKQRQEGISGLEDLHSQQANELLGSMGIGVSATNAKTASSPGYFQNLLQLMQASTAANNSRKA